MEGAGGLLGRLAQGGRARVEQQAEGEGDEVHAVEGGGEGARPRLEQGGAPSLPEFKRELIGLVAVMVFAILRPLLLDRAKEIAESVLQGQCGAAELRQSASPPPPPPPTPQMFVAPL